VKSSDLWTSYREYTEQLTGFSRQLAFAAVALGWIFKGEDFSLPPNVKIALGFVTVFFLADVLQYFLSAHLLRAWIRKEEKRHWREHKTVEGDFDKPWWLDQPAFVLFNLKICALLGAFTLLGWHLFRVL
jgi:hypothetical protein